MTLHDGKLWVAGDCSDPSGFFHYFASYDGERWCRYNFIEKAQYMTVFQDRMYAYLLHYPGGPEHRFVRWLDDTEPDWCSDPIYIGVEELTEENSLLSVYPNPTNSTVTVNLPIQNQHKEVHVNLYDVHGRLFEVPMVVSTENVELDLGNLPTGMYFGQVVIGSELRTFKVVRE